MNSSLLIRRVKRVIEKLAVRDLAPSTGDVAKQSQAEFEHALFQLKMSMRTAADRGRVEEIVHRFAPCWISGGKTTVIRRAKRDRADRESRVAVREMLASLSVST